MQLEVKPIVIWKSENPHCFKGVRKTDLPVEYHSQPKAWVTGDVLHKVISKVRLSGKSVLLFIDNAGCHPPDMGFLPANISPPTA